MMEQGEWVHFSGGVHKRIVQTREDVAQAIAIARAHPGASIHLDIQSHLPVMAVITLWQPPHLKGLRS